MVSFLVEQQPAFTLLLLLFALKFFTEFILLLLPTDAIQFSSFEPTFMFPPSALRKWSDI